MAKSVRILTVLLIISLILVVSCSFFSKTNDNASLVWADGYIGSNRTLRYFPDIYANYWIYAFDVTSPGMGLKINGNYPDARFFNFVLYDENSTIDIASLEDVNIKPKIGKNPYVTTVANPTEGSYELYVLPLSLKGKVPYKNVLYYTDTYKKLSIILRCYVPADEKTGNTLLPYVSAINAYTMTPMPLPPRLVSGLDTLPAPADQTYPYADKSEFFRSPRGVGYPNTPAEYLFTSNELQDGKVFTFRFKPLKEPENPSEYATADVRYWSVCIGDARTYAAAAKIDKDFRKSDDGWVTVVLADPDSPNYKRIEEKVNASDELNLIPFQRFVHGKGFLVLYRNMVINSSLPDYKRMDTLTIIGQPVADDMKSSIKMGNYGPRGKMYTEAVFLDEAFTVSDIRNFN